VNIHLKKQTESTKARRGPGTVEILRIRIDLAYVSPTVTRTILVRANTRLATLHKVIQCAMGWENCHLHEFEKEGVLYGEEDPFAVVGDPERKSVNIQVGTLLTNDGDSLSYLYDFGDSWHHTVTRETQLPPDPDLRRPSCIAGENACPPEDVGGPAGYMDYLEAVLDPKHPEHAEMIQWRGPGFHPQHFSVDDAEARLEHTIR